MNKGPKTVDLNSFHPRRELLDRALQNAGMGENIDSGTPLLPSILTLDPGETTGWCVLANCNPVQGTYFEHLHGQVDCGSRQGALNVDELASIDAGSMNDEGEARGVARLIRLADEHPTAVIVVEDFIVDMRQITKSRSALSPVRITARLQQELWQRGRTIIRQERSNPKVTMNDDRLREIGAYQREGGLQHARDADRHAIYFLRRCQNSAELRHHAWPWAYEEVVKKPAKLRKKRAPGTRILFGD